MAPGTVAAHDTRGASDQLTTQGEPIKDLLTGRRLRIATKRLAAAGITALGLGSAVYLIAREAGSSLLPGGLGLDPWPTVTGALPAACHTAGFALLCAAAWGPSQRTLVWSVVVWIAIGWGFELLQHPLLSSAMLAHPDSVSINGPIDALLALVARYAHFGTFDPMDLVATALGGAVALVLGRRVIHGTHREAARHHASH